MNTPDTLHAMPSPRNPNRGALPVATLYGPEPIGAIGAVPLADVFSQETAARLVACWNACSGIETKALKAMRPGAFAESLERLRAIAVTLEKHPEAKEGNAKVHYAYCRAKSAAR